MKFKIWNKNLKKLEKISKKIETQGVFYNQVFLVGHEDFELK